MLENTLGLLENVGGTDVGGLASSLFAPLAALNIPISWGKKLVAHSILPSGWNLVVCCMAPYLGAEMSDDQPIFSGNFLKLITLIPFRKWEGGNVGLL